METVFSIISSSSASQLSEKRIETDGDCVALCQSNVMASDISWPFQISDSFGLVSLQDRRVNGNATEMFSYSDDDAINYKCKEVLDTRLIKLPLRASLFPNCPPTFYFSYSSDIDCELMEDLGNVMIWQLTSTTPRILKKILINSGFKFTKQLKTWIGTWAKNTRAYEFQNMTVYQKFNHFPGTFQIGRKDRLWRTIYRMQLLHNKEEYNFVPDTFILPNDLKKLFSAWKNEKGKPRWIVKPPASARGKGVYVVHRLDQLPKSGSFVVQKYLSNSYLINGTKFDLRVYVYVPSFNPLRIYVYKSGLVRFASVKFSNDTNTLHNRYMHLTNCTVNRNHLSYSVSKDCNSCEGQKWSLKAFWAYLEADGIDTSEIWNNMIDLIIKTIISCEPSVRTLSRGNIHSGYSCHEMFGFDIILDSNLKPFLLEVNVSPSLESKSCLDKSLKGEMMAELLNLAGYKIPVHLNERGQQNVAQVLKIDPSSVCLNVHAYHSSLSKDEVEKQTKLSVFERELYLTEILENLTWRDVAYLTEVEDELNRAENFQRIFPSITSFRFLKYFNFPQYYANLLDAWEHKYGNQRESGRQLLRQLITKSEYSTILANNSDSENNVAAIRRCRNKACGLNVKLRTRRRTSTSAFHKTITKKRCLY